MENNSIIIAEIKIFDRQRDMSHCYRTRGYSEAASGAERRCRGGKLLSHARL